MKAQVETIREMLTAERRMRGVVFRGRKRDLKVAEVDRALIALSQIERQLKEDHPEQFRSPAQMDLFEPGREYK